MKKTKILAVFGLLLAMGITACNNGGSQQSNNGGGEQSQQSGDPSQGGGEHTHAFGDWTQTKAPTCTEKGTEERVCACGEKETRDVKALGHDWNEWEVKAEATCAAPGSRERTCKRCNEKETEVIPQLAHDFGDDAEKVDVLEEEGSVKEEMYKCKNCTTTSVRWSALEYDKTKTAERSTKSPESRGSGKAIRFDSTANYQDKDTTKKGCHIVYNVYIPEAIEKASIYMKTSKRTDSTLPPVVNIMEDDNAKGYEYVDGELVRPATRYGLKIDGEVVIVPEDKSGQEWKDGINWYSLPGEYKFETAGIHEIEFYNLGGYRADFYEFALVGFGPHEHVANYKITDAKTNAAGKVVKLGVDSFTGEKAAMVELNQINGAYASSKTSASGEPEVFALGDQDTAFKAANTYKLDKGKVIAFQVDLTAAVTGAKLEVGAEFNNAERYFYNMKIRGNETMTDNNADKDTEDAWRYYVKVNDGEFQPMGSELKMQEVLDKTAGKYMPLGTFDLKQGANIIYIRQGNIGYRVTMDNPFRVIFKGDATIDGTHAHLYEELVSETAPTCTEAGKKVMKCVCGETAEIAGEPALGHSFTEGDAVKNSAGQDVIPLTCSVCQAKGFRMALRDCEGNDQIETDGKVKNGKELKYTFKVGQQVGKVAFQMNAMLGSGDNEFANGGNKGTYTLKAGTKEGTITCNGHKLSEYGATNAKAVWFEMGQVTFEASDVDANGEIVISIKFPTTQDYRHKYQDAGVRIVFLAA